MDAPKFLTLTLKTDSETLEEALDALASAWRGLRKVAWWKRAARGGVYCMEVTRGLSGSRWHPHLHVIFDGDFVPQGLIADTWSALTGGSSVVDIRAVRSRRQIARYVAKYVAKGNAFESWTQDEIVEYARAMHGRRVTHTFGSLHGKTADETKEDADVKIETDDVSASMVEVADQSNVEAADVIMTLGPRVSSDWRLVLGVPRLPGNDAYPPLLPEETQELADAIHELHCLINLGISMADADTGPVRRSHDCISARGDPQPGLFSSAEQPAAPMLFDARAG